MTAEPESAGGTPGSGRDVDDEKDLHLWPPHTEDLPEGSPEAVCASCGRRWRIHGSLGGYRLKCTCGDWIDVPELVAADAPEPARLDDSRQAPSGAACRDAAAGVVQAAAESAPEQPSEVIRREPATEARDLEATEGTLVEASLGERRKWTDRTLLELGALVLAFWLPALVVELTMEGRARSLALPFAGMAGGLLVLLVGLAAGGAAFQAVRRAAARDLLEASLAAVITVSAGMAWSRLISLFVDTEGGDWLSPVVRDLGLPWTLVVIAVFPAIFEELAFRGIVQGRLTVLLGPRQGLLLTAVAFALAHGMTLGLPIHAALGIYLCWLRARCGSVLPGMATHFLHNAGVVLLTAYDLF